MIRRDDKRSEEHRERGRSHGPAVGLRSLPGCRNQTGDPRAGRRTGRRLRHDRLVHVQPARPRFRPCAIQGAGRRRPARVRRARRQRPLPTPRDDPQPRCRPRRALELRLRRPGLCVFPRRSGRGVHRPRLPDDDPADHRQRGRRRPHRGRRCRRLHRLDDGRRRSRRGRGAGDEAACGRARRSRRPRPDTGQHRQPGRGASRRNARVRSGIKARAALGDEVSAHTASWSIVRRGSTRA